MLQIQPQSPTRVREQGQARELLDEAVQVLIPDIENPDRPVHLVHHAVAPVAVH